MEQRWFRHRPLECGEQQNVGAGGIHLVALPRVDGLLLNSLDLEALHLRVEHLTQVHDDALVDFLPEMRTEYLDQRDLQSRNLAVHKNTRQVKLHLETDVHVGPVNRGGPPKREPSVGDLVQPGPLCVS